MNVKIQSVKFDADQKLIDFVETKIAKLDKFFEGIVDADVILKIEKDHEKGNKAAVISVEVPGDKLVAERQCKSFEESVDQCVDALKKQLEKAKDKHK